MRQPGLSQKINFFARVGGFCTWLTRTPPFFAKASWVMIFRESILRGYRHASRFFKFVKTRVVRRPFVVCKQSLWVVVFLFMLTGSRVTWTYWGLDLSRIFLLKSHLDWRPPHETQFYCIHCLVCFLLNQMFLLFYLRVSSLFLYSS